MIKRLILFVFCCGAAVYTHASLDQQTAGMAGQETCVAPATAKEIAALPEQSVWVVERLSVDRIKKHAERYQQQLKRSSTMQKVLWGVGGCAVTGLLAWACYSWIFAEKKETKVDVPSSSGPEISEQDFRHRVLTTLETEIAQENRMRRSLWESIKRSANNAVMVAFYCFMGTKLLGMLYSMWDEIGPKILDYLGMFSSKDQIKMHERVVSLIGQTMGGVIPEYEHAVSHALALGGNEPVSLSFVTFLEREIMKQHTTFIHALELVIACLAELQEHEGKDNKALQQVFDDQVRVFWGVLGAYAEALEAMLNAPLDKDKPAFCKKVAIICRQIYLQSEHFLEGCKNVVLAA